MNKKPLMYINIFSFYGQKHFSVPQKSDEDSFHEGVFIIFKTEEGEEVGKIISIDETAHYKIEKKTELLRESTASDLQKIKQYRKKEETAKKNFQKKVEAHQLEMNLVSVNYSFDDTKIEFIFTSSDRVDFRELVRDLAKALRKKIHLKQIGPRDRSKIVGGAGICGRDVCCGSYLKELRSVLTKAADVQDLNTKSKDKISGLCGKLRCCLNYEISLYEELRKNYPGVRTVITFEKKKAFIKKIDYINDRVYLEFEDRSMQVVDSDQIKDFKKIIPKKPKAKE